MASCPGFVAKPVHLVIKSWHLDFSSMKSAGASSPCTIDIDSKLVVTNAGTADYAGGFNDASFSQSCGSNAQWGCGNQGWGGQAAIFQLAQGASVTYTPSSTGQKAPFHVDCSPPSASKTVHGGSYLAKWASCRPDITCNPGFAVATEDLLSVCFAAKNSQLLSACH
jgi:hypothetical protein